MPIRSFKHAFAFLSNFYGLAPGDERFIVTLDGEAYPTVEHAYVAAKLTDPALREEISDLPKPGQAKPSPSSRTAASRSASGGRR